MATQMQQREGFVFLQHACVHCNKRRTSWGGVTTLEKYNQTKSKQEEEKRKQEEEAKRKQEEKVRNQKIYASDVFNHTCTCCAHAYIPRTRAHAMFYLYLMYLII